jgi:hypothetical protein
MISIEGDEALAEFRARLTGRRGLELLEEHGGRALIQLPVGVGKSRFLDEITRAAVESGLYHLVVVLAPTRRLIEERRPLRERPPGLKIVDLRPRPVQRCGPVRNAEWAKYQLADLGALGRAEVCSRCPRLPDCFWPGQYGRELEGTRIAYATHAHLERSPGFLARLQSWARAERVLTLIDEFDFAGKSFGASIGADELARFADALEAASPSCSEPLWEHQRWVFKVSMLREASTRDLQEPGWGMPRIPHEWAAIVQRAGVDQHGDHFRFPGYRLGDLCHSPIETRRRSEDGSIEFGTRPYIGDCLIFTGTTDLRFARYRLGEDLGSPFADYRFTHPGTRWYNFASPIGSRRYFPGNRAQILDFFAGLTSRRIAEGKRVLLVAKKCFLPACRDGLVARFAELGIDLAIVTENWSEDASAGTRAVPLINYGVIGTNGFEGFDCAYCLTSYYIDVPVLDRCLQDLTRSDLRLPIRIETGGNPKRRRARVANPSHADYDVARLAQPALEYKEHGTVVQTVGRVRPFTRPREIITFQMSDLPGITYDNEFRTLEEARRFFGVPTGRQQGANHRADRIATLRQGGLSQAETAAVLGVTERTIRNYERKEDRK